MTRATVTVPRLGAWDWLVAVPVIGVALLDSATTTEYAGGTPRLVVAAALQTVPLLVRRPLTLPAVAVSLLGVVVEVSGERAYGGVYGLLAFLLLVHAVSRWTSGTRRRAAGGLLVGGAVMHVLSQGRGPVGVVGAAFFVAVLAAVAWTLGRVSRAAESREAEIAAEQARLLAEERARIARELHDVVGHALAGIALTAGAAERRADAGAADALGLIRTVSRDAAADVRRLVGLLREEHDATDEHDREPRPTLDSLPVLVEQARRAGQDVRLAPLPPLDGLSPGLQVAAYRIVQEALTNAAKHAPRSDVCVELRREVGELGVEVRSRGPVTGPPGRSGHGLLGMAERVRLYDGRLVAEPTVDGFVVDARFPL